MVDRFSVPFWQLNRSLSLSKSDKLRGVMEQASRRIDSLRFHLDVKRPPRDENWQCSIVFDGKDKSADFNAGFCLFLEEWRDYRDEQQEGTLSKDKYQDWQEKTLAYYSSTAVNSDTDKSE